MIVLANGVFDILHVGHVLYLEAAAKMGDKLIVSITRNVYVNKGPHRPMFDEYTRLRVIRSLRCVDNAFLCDGALDALRKAQPDIFVKGQDYVGKIQPEHQEYCDKHGIKIAFTNEPLYSTTAIINDRLRAG